jgi:hypothetical protein
MRKIILSIALLFFVQFSFSQTKENYDNVLGSIVKAFNAKSTDQIFDLFTADLQAVLTKQKLSKIIEDTHSEKGVMGNSELILEEESGNSYLTEFENASMLVVLKLSPEGKISNFSIQEY